MYQTFSNWIFIWFFLFCCGITTFNPLILLIIGYIATIGGFIYIYLNNAPKQNIIKYFIINICIKFLFIVTILNNFSFVFSWDDVVFAITLYVLYLLLMVIKSKNFVNHYLNVFDAYIHDKEEDKKHLSGVSRLYDSIYLYIYKI